MAKSKAVGGVCRSSYCSPQICDPGPRKQTKSQKKGEKKKLDDS